MRKKSGSFGGTAEKAIITNDAMDRANVSQSKLEASRGVNTHRERAGKAERALSGHLRADGEHRKPSHRVPHCLVDNTAILASNTGAEIQKGGHVNAELVLCVGQKAFPLHPSWKSNFVVDFKTKSKITYNVCLMSAYVHLMSL